MSEHPRRKLRALTTLLALILLTLTSAPVPASAQSDRQKEQMALYQKFLDNYRGDPGQQKFAYDAAREYLRKYSDKDEVGKYVKKWAGKYEEAVVAWEKEQGKSDLYERIYDSQGTDPKLTHKLVKEFLKKYPDDAKYVPALRRWQQSYEGGVAPDALLKIERFPGRSMGMGVGTGTGGGMGTGGGKGYGGGMGMPATEATPSTGKYYALVIGNSNYRHASSLKTAGEDARAVEAVLRQRYGFETRLLLDADRQQVISALNSFRQDVDENASLLIYYAGHGHYDREADKGYWLPVDARPDDNANWISADDINTNAKVIPAKHVLIISDSSYSRPIHRGTEPAISEMLAREKLIQKMYTGRSRTLMASGGNEPVTDGGEAKNSVFASALLRGLSEMEPKMFTGKELFLNYVQGSAAGRANQTPEYNPLGNSGHDGGDFVFVRKQ